jgi:chemotaxis protein MotA
MNILLLIGVIIGFGGVLGGFMVEGGDPVSFLTPAPIIIVLGGTIGIALIAYPFSTIKKVPGALKAIMFHKKHNYAKLVDMLCDIANKARKDGLLSLESEADKMADPFIKRGLGYIADGVDPEFLKKVLNNEIDSAYKKLEDAARMFEGMGGTSPTMGVLGTVMGMTNVLKDMKDTDTIGEKIAGAFLATMYGIGLANLIWLPIGSHIKVVAEEESEYQEVVLEGLMAIQSGEPSTRLRDRLYAKIGNAKKNKKAEAPKAES